MNMKPYRHARLAATLLLVMGSSLTWAQQDGLRLGSSSFQVDSAIGLKLRIVGSRSNLFSIPGEDPFLPSSYAVTNRLNNKTFSSVIADWEIHASGLRASMGLVWRHAQNAFGESHPDDLNGLRDPSTFLGLGWSGQPFGTKSWRFSADVGTFVTGRGMQEIDKTSNTMFGLRDKNSGLQWKPYLGIGAQLNY